MSTRVLAFVQIGELGEEDPTKTLKTPNLEEGLPEPRVYLSMYIALCVSSSLIKALSSLPDSVCHI